MSDKKDIDEIIKRFRHPNVISDPSVYESMTHEERVHRQLEDFIPCYMREDLPAWYDYIMANSEYVSKEQLLFLLDKIDRPKKSKAEHKLQTLVVIKHLILSARLFEKQSMKECIQNWHKNWEPTTNYERSLAHQDFDAAYKRIHADLKKHFPDSKIFD